MRFAYHVLLSLWWRLLFLLAVPLTWFGWYDPAVHAAFHVLLHDEATIDHDAVVAEWQAKQ